MASDLMYPEYVQIDGTVMRHYLCDTDADLPSAVPIGSVAYVKETDSFWTRQTDDTWHDTASGGGGPHNHDGDYEPSGAITTHAQAANPHSTYLTQAEGDGLYEAAGVVAAHAASGDPHTVYLTSAEGNAAYSATDHTHQGGGNDPRMVVDHLSADQADITGTTLVEISGLTQTVGVGTWQFKYDVVWQTTATTTGVELVVDHTGTDTCFVSTAWTQTTGGAAATGVADQVTTATAQMIEGKSARVAGARTGVLQGVDTVNANQLTVIQGVIVVTVSGDLKLFMAAEAAALVCRAKAGSSLVLIKVS